MAELADALDLGSSVPDVKVQVLSGAPSKEQSVIAGCFFVASNIVLYYLHKLFDISVKTILSF